MKKKLIATAVAGALAVPAVAVAEEHTTFRVYGRINNALDYSKTQGASGTWDFRNVASRLGLQGSSDLGNGLTAVGRYEFATNTNIEGTGIADTRLGFVGISGGFGSITVGNQWSSFFNTVGTHIDPTFTLATTGYVAGAYRTSKTIKYSNTFGPVYVDWDVRMHNDPAGANNVETLGVDNCSPAGTNCEDIDGSGIGFSWGIGDAFTLAAAYDVDKRVGIGDVKRTGVAGRGNFGPFWVTLYWNQIDNSGVNTDGPGFWVGWAGDTGVSAMLGYGKADTDNVTTGDPDSWTLGIYKNFRGTGFRVYFEGITANNKVNPDQDTLLFGMRYDFSS